MNLKFTKRKVIGSVIITIVLWILLLILNTFMLINIPLISGFLELHNMAQILSLGNLFLFIIEMVVVYIIWSLIEK